MPSSPLNPQPSPMTAHSPGPNLAYMQSHPDSSPFAAMSPAAANWPGSPRPSPRPGQSPEHKLQPQGKQQQPKLQLMHLKNKTLHDKIDYDIYEPNFVNFTFFFYFSSLRAYKFNDLH